MNHRMHDYQLLGQNIFEAAELDPRTFDRQLDALRRSTGGDIAAGDTFVVAMRQILEDLSRNAVAGRGLPGWKAWFPNGFEAIKLAGGKTVIGIRPKKLAELLERKRILGNDWLPRNPREAGGALLRTSPIFADIGVKLSKREPSASNVFWEFLISKDYRADGQ